jgi:hypothetical protein
MSTAEKLLIGYGVLALLYGVVLGVPLAGARVKAPAASRHLVTTHLSGLIQGAMHLGLAFAIAAVSLDSGWATAAAALLVIGSLFELAGGTVNWLQGTGDQFAERSVGFRLNSMTGLLIVPGALIIAIAVLVEL